jgi:Rrf2 family nitric oxide-sensitive transcriptional repressor
MRLTLHSDYGLRVLLFLATRPGDTVSIGEVAAGYGISAHHLGKVAQRLGREGYVELLRGSKGGLRLARAPEEISIGEIVRRLEPDLDLVECFDPGSNTCPIVPACGLKGILAEARARFFETLDGHTLADAVGRPGALVRLLGPRRGVVPGRASTRGSPATGRPRVRSRAS